MQQACNSPQQPEPWPHRVSAQGSHPGKGSRGRLHNLSLMSHGPFPGDWPCYSVTCPPSRRPLSVALKHVSYPRPDWREHCECIQETSDGLLNYSLEQFLPGAWSQSRGVFSGQVPEALRRSCDVLEGRGSVWSEVRLVPEPWMWEQAPRASRFLFLELFMTPLCHPSGDKTGPHWIRVSCSAPCCLLRDAAPACREEGEEVPPTSPGHRGQGTQAPTADGQAGTSSAVRTFQGEEGTRWTRCFYFFFHHTSWVSLPSLGFALCNFNPKSAQEEGRGP